MNNDCKNVKNSRNNKKINPVFFITPNPNRGIGVETEIKDYHIICSQKSGIIDYLKSQKISVLCIDDEKIKNSGKILEKQEVNDYIRSKSKNGKANIITFKPSPKIAKICASNDFNYLGNNWELNRKLENKIEFVVITRKLKISNAKSRIKIIANSEKFKKQFNFENKNKYVIQLPRGFSGNSTFLIKNKNDLNSIIKRFDKREVKVSNYINGETFTVNAFVNEDGVIVSQPIFQITGFTLLNKNRLGTSGNDYKYAEKLKIVEKRKIFEYTKKIGEYMKLQGYKGVFGLDFLIAKNSVDLIEINPRLIASIPVFTKLQNQNKKVSFLFLHLAEFLGFETKLKVANDFSFITWSNTKSFNFSQLILRNTSESSLKISKSLISGIYEMKDEKLVLKKKEYFAKDLKSKEIFIQCLNDNSIISPDMEYANVQFSRGVINRGLLKSECKKIINFVLSKIKLKEI